jgi:hypothetical protein
LVDVETDGRPLSAGLDFYYRTEETNVELTVEHSPSESICKASLTENGEEEALRSNMVSAALQSEGAVEKRSGVRLAESGRKRSFVDAIPFQISMYLRHT